MENFREKFVCLDNIKKSMDDKISQQLLELRLDYFVDRDADKFMSGLDKIEMVEPKSVNYLGFETCYKKTADLYNCKLPLVIFGAGKSGIRTYKALTKAGYNVEVFCDNIKSGNLCGKKILSFKEVRKQYKQCFIIISVISPKEKIEIYDMLVRCKISRDMIFLETSEQILLYSGNQYFDLDVMNIEKEEVFLDCGSYDGETSLEFIKWAGDNAKKIIAVEPFDIAYENMVSNLKNCKCEVEYHKKSVWCEPVLLKFDTDNLGSTYINEQGMLEVEAETIDNILNGQKVTFIKMDIEGSELAALKGAAKTIKKYKPKLAICVYHKAEDIIEIPYFIYNLRNDYKYYLRHYAYPSTGETVLYCI